MTTLAAESIPPDTHITRGTHGEPASAEGAEPVEFAVLGGGVSGLALASWLARAGVRVLALEKSSEPGGVMTSQREGGFLFEGGPNTILDKSAAFDELIEWAGLAPRAQRVLMRSLPRHIWFNGRLNAVPTGPGGMLATGLLSPFGKLRALGDLFVRPVINDEPLDQFITRRLGREVYHRMFVPMVQGIGAGDPARLSVEHAFPPLKRFEREKGGILKGFIASGSAAKAAREAAGEAPRATSIVSFPDGLGELPRALAERLGPALRLGVRVDSVEPAPGGGALIRGTQNGEPRVWRAANVAVCSEAWTAAEWARPWAPELAAEFDQVHYSPMLAVALGIPSDSAKLPPGFGFLAARGQGLRVLGAILNSNFLPDRAPEGHAAMTVMLGGDLDPGALDLDDNDVMQTLRRDLGAALKWDGRRTVFRVRRWTRAIPQYGLNHGAFLRALRAAEAAHPGIHFVGNWRDGVSINDRIEKAREFAELAAPRILSRRAEVL